MKIETTKGASCASVKSIIYGLSGVGKTRLCATAPKPLIISAEEGLLSLRQFDIPVITITGLNDMKECHGWLTSSKEVSNYETVCFDSLSELSEIILADAKRVNKDPRKAYEATKDGITGMVKALRGLPQHVIYIANQGGVKDELTGNITNYPSFPGNKLQEKLPYLVDEVFRMYVQDKKRFLQTSADESNYAKDRSGALKSTVEANLTEIFKIIATGIEK